MTRGNHEKEKKPPEGSKGVDGIKKPPNGNVITAKKRDPKKAPTNKKIGGNYSWTGEQKKKKDKITNKQSK